ncbi:hypothetical protein L1987_79838 [Smallanthus sonchifolius]|uniref:Uncharacterized protein n=1 Tax=Smallanthus sonchifolius TaxID=185202 RepID=A0ACB8YL14_9ASTR|nr:hypothetical protein L1987_79838 [Smallanthus sonchifolius]
MMVWWLKSISEMFLYRNDVIKGGLGRIIDNINVYDGVVVFLMSDVALGFGIAAKSIDSGLLITMSSI